MYDFIIAGGGVAGLSLAYHLINSPLRDRSILIIDRQRKNRNDRTLSYWGSTPFDAIAYRSWDRLRVIGDDFDSTEACQYHMIRGFDFYQHVESVMGDPCTFIEGTIETVEDGAVLLDDGRRYEGRWIFDSRIGRNTPPIFQQHFCGWEIVTDTPAFDPEVPIFMDFRVPQSGELRFFYVLPLAADRALVECVQLSAAGASRGVKAYIEDVLGIHAYRVVTTEGGATPLCAGRCTRRVSQRVMNIGTRGGRVKPSSGYAFTRIQDDSAAIVESLLRHGHPFAVPDDPSFYRFCDAMMLWLMGWRPEWMKPLFVSLFRHNSMRRIFGFLDERAGVWQSARLTLSLVPELMRQTMRIPDPPLPDIRQTQTHYRTPDIENT